MRKRNRKYTPRTARIPTLVRVSRVFGPLNDILDQLNDDGTVHVSPKGVPIFLDEDNGRWYAIAPAVFGLIDHLEMVERRYGWKLPLDSLRRFHKRMENHMPLDAPIMDALHRDSRIIQQAMARLSPDELIDLLRQYHIKVGIERKLKDGGDKEPAA